MTAPNEKARAMRKLLLRRAVATLALLPLVLAFGAVPARADASGLRATGLRTDALDDPIGIGDVTPTLSWRLSAAGRGAAQSAYQVVAATSRDRLGDADLWDSGKVASGTANAVYRGTALTSRRQVWWRVRVWDGSGRASAWSAPARFETGLLAEGDWSAKWISDERWLNRAPTPVTVALPGGTRTRYLRLDVTKLGLPIKEGSSLLSRLQLAEIEALDAAGTNVAKGAAVTASEVREYPGKWMPEFVTDGSVTTQKAPFGYTGPAYGSQDPGHHIWLQLDLGAAKDVSSVKLYPRTDTMTSDGKTPNFPVDYTIQTSDSADGPFAAAKTVTGQEPPPAYQTDMPRLPLLARQFSLKDKVRSARLYITALGVYDATINGRAVSDAVLEPPNTDYRERAEYAAYDVTGLLRRGGNAIGVRLGNGTYNVTATTDRYTKYVGAQGAPKLLAQLEVTLADGTTARIATDSSWRTDLGPTTFTHWYGGEDEDARLAQRGWDEPSANLASWKPAAEAPDPGIALTSRMSPAIVPVGRRETVKVTRPKKGTYVFDLGENVAGWPQIRVGGARGTKLTLKPGERLGSDGLVEQGTMIAGGAQNPPIEDNYTLAGTGTETWHPRFVYHGFRYVQVTGLPSEPSKNAVSAVVLRAGNASAGSFESSDLLLNGIHRIIDRSIQGNMFSILTDCPDREKLGWLEETQLVQGTITRNYDVAAYYPALLRNMAEAQTADGLVPDIAPEYVQFSGGVRDDPNWGSAIIMAAWQHYRTYGDAAPLREFYPNMQRYLDYLTSKADGNLLDYGLGDWAAVDQTTPRGIAATYGYQRSAATLARIAELLGKDEDAARYDRLAGDIAEAFNAKYLDEAKHTYGSGSQAGDAFALDLGIVPDGQRQAVLDHLVASIKAGGHHLTVGEIALPAVFRTLSAAGRDDVILAVAQQVTSPSYGYQVAHGATSLTEYWDGPTGYGSQNHFMLGAIDEWFGAGLAGIRQADESAAFGSLVIRPAVVGDLTRAASSYETPRGTVSSSWRRSGHDLRLDVTVPPGAPARVEVPLLGASGAKAPAGAKPLGVQDGRAVYEVGSGSWTFAVRTPAAVRQDRTQLAIEPPFGVDIPVIDGKPTRAEFRVTNLERHPVTVPVRAAASEGFTATAGGRVTIPAGGSAGVPVTLANTGSGKDGTVTVTVDDESVQAPLRVTSNAVRTAAMSASSTHSGSSPAWTNDGGTDSGVWLNGTGGWNDDTAGAFPDTLTATWDEPRRIGRVKVFTLDSPKYPAAKTGVRDFDVQARVDGAWRTVASVTGSTAGTVEKTFAPVSATALRLLVHDSNDHNYSRVIELEGYPS
ncbi:family 78 glycoside hydrolase catalytic domain [Actinomadura madurae]|uniref:family 78 glycoside hydrolase catalytic domain n=2 Tax=Actinomadura madurae TaxID=1993 RepID=UPI0020D21278|nr:family 78 glycoside hydrolase catalytic domain [Actinomadura madurae]MCP9948602.1 family 78 glycoside hydrolase catalytic domain [Actinomadura madurae]MCP9977864.1 family 78 glycoside hydrolase catalytic domain [Actinomadura madurae]